MIAFAVMFRIYRMQSWVFPAIAFVSVLIAGLWFNGGEWYIPSVTLTTFGVTSINLKSILFFFPVTAIWIECFFIIWAIQWAIGASARKTRIVYREAINAANRAARNAQEAKQERRAAKQQAKASEKPRYEQPNARPEQPQPSATAHEKIQPERFWQWSETGMSFLIKLIANAPTFVVLYLLCMLPTYFLPYLGSNSLGLNTAAVLGGGVYGPQFWLHLILLIILCVLAWARGIYVGKTWIVIFPILALVFDMVPGLSFIPLVPTFMHLLAIILGVASQRAAAQT